MLSLFKRLNKMGVVGLAFVGTGIFLSTSACKKRERLAASTFNFAVRPPAITVVKGQSVTLTALSGAASDVSPTWTLTPDTAGSLTPAIGRNVVFTASTLGDAVVTAIQDGMSATTQIAVVTSIPSSNECGILGNTFNVYSDLGLPVCTGIDSDIFTTCPSSFLSEESTGYTPEGLKYQHAADMANLQFWGVTLDKGTPTGVPCVGTTAGLSKDLSSFSAGTLKFSLRLGRTLAGGETLKVELTHQGGAAASYSMTHPGDFSGLSTDWQEISLPIAADFPTLDLTKVSVPFAIVPSIPGSTLTFDVDAIRWEK